MIAGRNLSKLRFIKKILTPERTRTCHSKVVPLLVLASLGKGRELAIVFMYLVVEDTIKVLEIHSRIIN